MICHSYRTQTRYYIVSKFFTYDLMVIHVMETLDAYCYLNPVAFFIDKGLNYKLEFGSSELGYVLSPGPEDPIDQLSVCLWLKTSVTSTFVYYHVEGETGPGFQFGITSSKYLFGKINGSLAKRCLI